MTLFFRQLSQFKKDQKNNLLGPLKIAFYTPGNIKEQIKKEWETWIKRYIHRLETEALSDEKRQKKMNKINPKYVLRNYMAQLAIDQANAENYDLLHELQTLLKHPYDEQPHYDKWYSKRPDWARHKIGCSRLSCSS